MPPPNILLITTDQHRWDFGTVEEGDFVHLSAYERMRREGVILPNAYSVCPICTPTRMGWNHAIYPSQISLHKQGGTRGFVPPHLGAMPRVLQSAGYSTALIGKLHYRPPGCSQILSESSEIMKQLCGYDFLHETSGKSMALSQDCSFTDHLKRKGLLERYRTDVAGRIRKKVRREPYRPTFLPPEDCMDAYIGAKAREYLSTVPCVSPFFAHVSFCNPHFPYDPPEEYFGRYRPKDMPAPFGVKSKAHIRYWQEIRAAYCGLLSQLNDEINSLLNLLESRSLLNNTVVFVMTDHGDLLGDFHYEYSKIRPEDSSSRTPLLVRYPKSIRGGQVLDCPFESVDLPMTILEAAGLKEKSTREMPAASGRSAWEYLTGKTNNHREWAYSEFGQNPWYHDWRMVVDREWKYIFDPNEGDRLIHRSSDPEETKNLASSKKHRAVLAEYRRKLIETVSSFSMPPLQSFYPENKCK